MPEVNVSGVQLYYEIHGDGPLLLLVSGLGGDSQSWLPVLDELSKHFRVLTFDNRGAGRSDPPDTFYTIADLAADARHLLAHLGIGRAHLLGHSMGGYIAQELAITYPECVDKLILAGTAPFSSDRNNTFFRTFLGWWEKGMDLETRMRVWAFWLFTPERFHNADFIEEYISAAVKYPHQQSIPGFKGQIEAIASFNARDRLEKIRAETLIIEGKEDILILPREAETLKRIPGSSLLYVEEAAHLIYVEQPEAFSRAVLKFLEKT